MNRYAVIQSGAVFTVTESDDVALAAREGWVECDVTVAVGDTWDGQAFSRPGKSAAEIRAEIVDATQARLDAFAQTRNYDGILSACTYAASAVAKFHAEGSYCVGARDDTWEALYQIMDDVTTGARPMPSGYAEIEPELPDLSWPA